jgi:hypothetical protein
MIPSIEYHQMNQDEEASLADLIVRMWLENYYGLSSRSSRTENYLYSDFDDEDEEALF